MVFKQYSHNKGDVLMNEFLKRIELFLKQSGMSATSLGIKALKNPRFVFDIRKGNGCTVKSMQKVDDFMLSYKKRKVAR